MTSKEEIENSKNQLEFAKALEMLVTSKRFMSAPRSAWDAGSKEYFEWLNQERKRAQ